MRSLLAITAHPDDESFLFGGALATFAARGVSTALLCFTDGQVGRTGGLCSREELPLVRRKELEAAVQVLRIENLITPGWMDGSLRDVDRARALAYIRDVVTRFDPAAVLTFGPEGASGHDDHRTCWDWTCAAVTDRPVFGATFPDEMHGEVRGGTPLPVTNFVDVPNHAELMRAAFACHATQQDHKELHERMLGKFAGREYYSRVNPPWPAGEPRREGLDL